MWRHFRHFTFLSNIGNDYFGFGVEGAGSGNILKEPDMLKRLNEIEKMESDDKNHILYTIDGLIKSVKLKNIAALSS